VEVALVPEIRSYVAYKGSIAVQGVSLTVAGLGGEGFEVALVPETVGRTTLGELRQGDRVNVEVDLLARYLERLEGVRRDDG
jgi:riboflavin synthase